MTPSQIVGYHLDPHACGVAKFNADLARRLGVRFVGLREAWQTARPLLSLKWGELSTAEGESLCDRLDGFGGEFGVFWHDQGDDWLTARAQWRYVADPSLRSDCSPLWCPPTLAESPREQPAPVRLLTFGMAHKLQLDFYRKAWRLVTEAQIAAQLRVSLAIHEEYRLSSATDKFAELSEIVGPGHLHVLGSLADGGLVDELRQADVLLAFFPDGVRANNTTVMAALSVGCPVLTNLDAGHPVGFAHNYTMMDINALLVWPFAQEWRRVGEAGKALYESTYSWDRFLAALGG